MFIKEILLTVNGCKHKEIMAFEGNQESFFSCLEIISSQNKQYLLNFEVVKRENVVSMLVHINGVNKEFQKTVNTVIDSIENYYRKEYGADLIFSLKKDYVFKELITDFLHLKSRI